MLLAPGEARHSPLALLSSSTCLFLQGFSALAAVSSPTVPRPQAGLVLHLTHLVGDWEKSSSCGSDCLARLPVLPPGLW